MSRAGDILEIAALLLRDLETSDAAAYDHHASEALYLLRKLAPKRREDWRARDAPHYLVGHLRGDAKRLRAAAEKLLREADHLEAIATGIADGIEAARADVDNLRMRYVVENAFDPGVGTNLANSLPRAYGPIWTIIRRDTGEVIGRRRASSEDIAVEAAVTAAERAGAAIPPGTEIYATADGSH